MIENLVVYFSIKLCSGYSESVILMSSHNVGLLWSTEKKYLLFIIVKNLILSMYRQRSKIHSRKIFNIAPILFTKYAIK